MWTTTSIRRMCIALFGALTLGCSSDSSTNPQNTSTITAAGSGDALAFSPQSVTISASDSVKFVFKDITHNVVFDDPEQIGVPGDILTVHDTTVSRTFTTVGTFAFHCTIHPVMTGQVVVQ